MLFPLRELHPCNRSILEDPPSPSATAGIPIAVVDDHYLVREGVCSALRAIGGYEVVLCVENGQQYMDRYAAHATAAIALVDMHSCGKTGTELLVWMKAAQPATRLLATSRKCDVEQFRKAYQAGACGFVPKTIGLHELRTALNDVRMKGSHYHDALMREHVLAMAEVNKAAALQFTPRELEVGRLLCAKQEYTVAQVADLLHRSEHTVNTHRKQLYKKLKVQSTCGLMHKMMELDLL
jgi:two-component system, NarL family, nitrate/nitrite response regulator NarL